MRNISVVLFVAVSFLAVGCGADRDQSFRQIAPVTDNPPKAQPKKQTVTPPATPPAAIVKSCFHRIVEGPIGGPELPLEVESLPTAFHNHDIVIKRSQKGADDPVNCDYLTIHATDGDNPQGYTHSLAQRREIDGKVQTLVLNFRNDQSNQVNSKRLRITQQYREISQGNIFGAFESNHEKMAYVIVKVQTETGVFGTDIADYANWVVLRKWTQAVDPNAKTIEWRDPVYFLPEQDTYKQLPPEVTALVQALDRESLAKKSKDAFVKGFYTAHDWFFRDSPDRSDLYAGVRGSSAMVKNQKGK